MQRLSYSIGHVLEMILLLSGASLNASIGFLLKPATTIPMILCWGLLWPQISLEKKVFKQKLEVPGNVNVIVVLHVLGSCVSVLLSLLKRCICGFLQHWDEYSLSDYMNTSACIL